MEGARIPGQVEATKPGRSKALPRTRATDDRIVSRGTMTKPEHQKLDCFRLLNEMDKAGVNNAEVARRLGKGKSTIQYWKSGGEPCWSEGNRLIALHAYVTAEVQKTVSTSL